MKGTEKDAPVQFTPARQLETLFVLDGERIVSTREPNPSLGPLFSIVRDAASCVWAVHAVVPKNLANQLDALASEEPPIHDFQREPLHARQYVSLLGGRVESGPAFTFPQPLRPPHDIVTIDRVDRLNRHFRGWTAEELSERAPVLAIVEDGHAVSVCFCARRTADAAEAGLETAVPFRGRGLGPRVTVAWALAIQDSGRLPIYSTSWTNEQSLAVARKIGLKACASDWHVWR